MEIEITIPQKVAQPKVSAYKIRVDGDASKGQRAAYFSIDLIDENGVYVDTRSKVLIGADYNEFWPTFSTDKAAIAAIFPDVDLSSVPDNILNVL